MDLKERNEDYEFYPTTDEILKVVAPYLKGSTVLDIGCGTCKFKTYMSQWYKRQKEAHDIAERNKESLAKMRGERYYAESFRRNEPISNYYVIKKSRPLLERLDKDTICLGTDFWQTTLLDKPVDVIFCNPPYSEYEEWTKKIIAEGNYIKAFLVIPQRWSKNDEIKSLLEAYKTDARSLGTFDFYNAERKARAVVNLVKLEKKKYTDYYSSRQEDVDMDSFNAFFNKTFGMETTEKLESDYDREMRKHKEQKERMEKALVDVEGGKAQVLVDMYNEEYENLVRNLQAIMQLDEDILETFNFSVKAVKEAFLQKIRSLKILYWDRVFEEFDEITSRLTYNSRDQLKTNFKTLYTVDFTVDNIYSLILWVVKNANDYYGTQLVDFYKKLSSRENVKPYKSNTRLFEYDGWRWSSEKHSHYVLDYRIIMSSPFRSTWSGSFDTNSLEGIRTMQDIRTIARNLGFDTIDYQAPTTFGQKYYVYTLNGEVLFEYKIYMNGNMHVKFNKEFTKAMNVEVSRLLGWIRSAEDIKKEFPDELAKGAEKYFKRNYTAIGNNGFSLLTY